MTLKMLDVGFTGTREGLTEIQKQKLCILLQQIPPCDFHHGDCIGADEQAAEIAKEFGFRLVCHPPAISDLRAFVVSDITHEPKPYLTRNRLIVQASDLLIGAPKELEQQSRSGTWATIRYAIRSNVQAIIVWPDGRVS